MRTRETIEAQTSEQNPQNTQENKQQTRGERIAPWRWKPGQSGNPGGRPKNDMAQEIARAVFEKNPEIIYKAYAKALAKGQAFAFQVISDRAYGKLKETREIGNDLNDVPDAGLAERITQLERELGLASAIDEAGRVGITKARADKANGHAQDSDVLPGNGAAKTGALS